MFIYASHNVLTETESPHGYHLLCCLQAYLDLTMWEALEVHTEETIASRRKAVKRLGNLVTVSNSLGKQSQLTFSYRHIQTNLQRLNCLRILTFQSSMRRIMYLMILSKRVLFTTIPLNFLNNYMAHSRFGTSGKQISRMWHLKLVSSFGYFHLILQPFY